MTATSTTLTVEQKRQRRRAAARPTSPSPTSRMFRSSCDACGSADIAWVSVDDYVRIAAGGIEPDYVRDSPGGDAWMCLNCDNGGYMGTAMSFGSGLEGFEDVLEDGYERAEEGYRRFAERFPEDLFPDELRDALAEAMAHDATYDGGAHAHALTALAGNLVGDHELRLAAASLAREARITDSSAEFLSMAVLSLLAAPIVSRFAPETGVAVQMPVLVKKLGQKLEKYWSCGKVGFQLPNEEARFHYATGLLIRTLIAAGDSEVDGFYGDTYTQWLGENAEVLIKEAEKLKAHGGLDFGFVASMVGEESANSYIARLKSRELRHSAKTTSEEEDVEQVFEPGCGDQPTVEVEDLPFSFTYDEYDGLLSQAHAEGLSGLEGLPAVAFAAELLSHSGAADLIKGRHSGELLVLTLSGVDQRELAKLIPTAKQLNRGAAEAVTRTLMEKHVDAAVGRIAGDAFLTLVQRAVAAD